MPALTRIESTVEYSGMLLGDTVAKEERHGCATSSAPVQLLLGSLSEL